MKIFKRIKKVWHYFFPRQIMFHPLEEKMYIRREDEKKEIKMFFEPLTVRDKFNESKGLKDFITKLDNTEKE